MKIKGVHHHYHKMEVYVCQEASQICIEAINTESPNSNDVTIIDGAAAMNMLKPTPAVKTFRDYAKQVFIPYIKVQLQHAKRVDVVWDEYIPNSLKKTREKSGKGIRRRVKSSTKLPSNWHEFLRVNENKTKLFVFLANRIVFPDFGQQVLCNPPRGDVSSLSSCNHEEADTRMMVPVADAVQIGLTKVLLRTVDTDVVVIAIAVSQALSISELWITLAAGKNLRFLPVHEIVSSLGPKNRKLCRCSISLQAVIQFHLFLGKIRKRHGKRGSHITRLQMLLTSCLTDQKVYGECIMNILERFIVLLYDRTCPKMKVSEARKMLFTQKGRSLELIPATRAASLQHVKRAVYQVGYCWGQATTPMAVLPAPLSGAGCQGRQKIDNWGGAYSYARILPN